MPTATAIIALRFCTGMALAWVYPPGMKIAAGWFLERRGAALGFVVGALAFGSAMPHLLAWLGSGLPWRSAGWRVLDAARRPARCSSDFGVRTARTSAHPHRSIAHALRDRLAQARRRGWRCSATLGHMWELYAMWTWIAAFAAAGLAGQRANDRRLADRVHHDRQRSDRLRRRPAAGPTPGARPRIAGDRDGRQRRLRADLAIVLSARRSQSLLALAAVWGFTVVADSAQFSALVIEHSPRTHVGTALTLQTSAGFLLTMVSMRLVPVVAARIGWRWAFVILVPGPAFGAWAMKQRPGPSSGSLVLVLDLGPR